MRKIRELFLRMCEAETEIDYLQNELIKLEKRIKKLEKSNETTKS